jgi:hypothetical protein
LLIWIEITWSATAREPAAGIMPTKVPAGRLLSTWVVTARSPALASADWQSLTDWQLGTTRMLPLT